MPVRDGTSKEQASEQDGRDGQDGQDLMGGSGTEGLMPAQRDEIGCEQ